MAWSYGFDAARDVLMVKGTGAVIEDDLRKGTAAAIEEIGTRPRLRCLIDYSQVTEIRLTVDTVRLMAESPFFQPESRRAFLAPTDLAFGMARMYQTFAELSTAGNVRVFRNRADAIAWLNDGVTPELAIE